MKRFFVWLLLFSATQRLSSQCSMYPVSLADRVNFSALIVEGTVVGSKSFWNSAGNYIYTSNLVRVQKVLKGQVSGTTIEVITEGGSVGLYRQTVDPSLQLRNEDHGIFLLNSFTQPSQFGSPVFTAYADQQGFIKFFANENKAREPFRTYDGISTLYNELEEITGSELPRFEAPSQQGKFSVPSIAAVTGISPTNISAGTGSILTITGSGFGSSQGSSIVEFKNADDGGSTYIQPHASQYVSWSNTQIQVMVPTRASTVSGTAGTGQIRVTVSSSTLSTQTLTVDYGELNVYYSTTNKIYNTRHQGENGAGGMTWNMYTSFSASTTAKAAFERAFETWRCNTYINWTIGSTVSTNTIAFDNVNVVRFDIGSELPSGVLGRCTSYYSGCITGTLVNWYVSELDIVFDEPSTSAITWQFGPTLASGSQYDFESVALHELGHGHQMSHVINTSDVMHYSLSNAQNKRSLIANNITAGNDVMTRNVVAVCGNSVMTALNATNCALAAVTASFNLASATVCAGTSVPLTSSSSGATSYTWTMTGGSPASSTQQNTITSFATAGTYSITLLVSNGTSTASLTKTISVISASVAVSSATACSGSSATLTASGATTYTWNPGNVNGSTQVFSPSSTTVYTVTGTASGCTASATGTLTVNSSPTVTASNATICAGSSTLLTASGAAGYTWNPGGLTGAGQNLSPSATTVYTITGSTGSCNDTHTVSITVNTTPTISAANATICSGTSTLIAASGASSYTWNPGALTGASQNLNPSSSTVYTITGANGSCSGTRTISVTVSPNPTITLNHGEICAGTSTVMTASGASSYTWNPGGLTGATQTLSPSATTIYTVTGGTGNCSSMVTRTLVVIASPTISIGNATICTGASTLMTASGASTYTWEPGSLSGSAQNLNPAATSVYTVTGTSGGCSSAKLFTITVSSTLALTVGDATLCSGASTVLTVSGASSYTWKPGNMTGASQTLNPSSSTEYTISGEAGTCSAVTTASIFVTPTPTLSVSNATLCSGNSTLLTVSGANNYTWQPGGLTGASQNLGPVSTTIYTVTGTNTFCTASTTVSINVTTTPTVSVSNASICAGGSTLVTASGASAYSWNPGGLSGASQNLGPAATTIYSLTGANGACVSQVKTMTLTVVAMPTVSVNDATLCSGSATVLTAGGASVFIWNPGNLSGPSQNLAPSVTTIYTVTGSNSTCSDTETLSINVTATPTLSISNASICSGASTVLTASGAGGYTWNPGALSGASQTLSPTVSSVYTVTGNNLSCTGTKTVSVNVTATPTVSVNNGSICSGTSTLITASGASGYSWQPGNLSGASQNLNPSATTVYSVTGFNGSCPGQVKTMTLTVVTTPTVTVNSASLCSGNSTVMTASGASVFVWNPGNLSGATQSLAPMSTTVYTVTGNNSTCSHSRTLSINVTATPTVSVNNGSICSGTSTLMTASGATTYSWNPGSLSGASQNLNPASTTVYSITGFNGSCASQVRTMTLTVVTTPTVTVNSASLCSGNSTVMAASGASVFVWNPGNLSGATQSLAPMSTTVYTVTGNNSTCSHSRTLSINVTATPTVSVNNGSICSGTSTLVTASGATTYSWNPGSLSGPSQNLNPSSTTVYSITGFNGSCASQVRTMTLTVVTTPTVTVSNATLCSGNSTVLTAGGAGGFSWNPGNLSGASQTLSPLSTTVYTVTGNNSTCTDTKTLVINVTSTPTISANNGSICSGTSTLMIAGGAAAYTWNPGSLSGASQNLGPAATTVYSITGFNGACPGQVKTITLAVVTTPTLTVTNYSLCSGNTVTLTAPGAPVNVWQMSSGTQTANNIIVAPVTTTNYTVTGYNSTCSNTKTLTVFVTTTPTVSANHAIICSGNSTVITASGAGTYSWQPGNLSGATQTLAPSFTSGYNITGYNGSCPSQVKTISVSVFPTPTLSVNNASICSGNSTVLAASGATSYTWNPGNLSGSSQTLSPGITTIYTVTGMSSNCYASKTLTVNVTITPTVSVNNGSMCSGFSVPVVASGAQTYSWNPGSLSGASQTLSPAATTIYSITGFNGSCPGQVSTMTLTVVPMPTLSVNNGSICSGNATVMTVSGASVMAWNPGNLAGATQTLSPMITTVYTVTGNNATCSDTKTLAINVTTTPTVTAPSGVICSGNSTVITASGAQAYSWSPGSLAGASQTLSPLSTLVYTITGSNGNCSGAPHHLTLTVNTTPTVAVNGASICSGSSAVITATGATGYTWQPGLLTGTTQALSPMVTTIYTVTGVTGACTSQPAFFAIDVTVQPTVTATSATVCAGETATLNASGAASYNWSTGSSSPGTIVSPSATTIYSVVGSTGICSDTATASVLVKPLPVISISSGGPPIICLGESLTLTASGAQSYTFQPGALTGSVVSVSPSVSLAYTVTGQSDGCTNVQSFAIAVDACTSVNELNDPAPVIYPQPVSGLLYLRFKAPFSGEVRLYNVAGQLLKENSESEQTEITLDMRVYPAGIYVIRTSSRTGEEYNLKVVRE